MQAASLEGWYYCFMEMFCNLKIKQVYATIKILYHSKYILASVEIRLCGGRAYADSARGTNPSWLPFTAAARNRCDYIRSYVLFRPANGTKSGFGKLLWARVSRHRINSQWHTHGQEVLLQIVTRLAIVPLTTLVNKEKSFSLASIIKQNSINLSEDILNSKRSNANESRHHHKRIREKHRCIFWYF